MTGRTWLRKYLKVELRSFFADPDTALEVIQRRNVNIHNDGRVSRQYRAAVGKEAPPIGTTLVTDETYVQRAIDQILVFGASAAAASWQKIAPRPGAISQSNANLHILNMRLMLLNRWDAVAGLAAVALTAVANTDSDRRVYQINAWLAAKRRLGLDAVASEVRQLDVSAAGLRFKVARSALLDDFKALERDLPKVLAAVEMSLSDLHSWPLLEEFRATPAYASILTSRASLDLPAPGVAHMRKATGRAKKSGDSGVDEPPVH
jgi:hypothetical protein